MQQLNRSTTKTGTVRRSETRRGGDGSAKRPKGHDAVQQAIKQLHPPEGKPEGRRDIDIVFVPGLGAHPEESWKSAKTGFNWTTHEDGIIKDFPRARVMLYMYESAWIGSLKVKGQVMSNIAMTLLVCLQSKRRDCKSRPIVFIGHSMGGLVIAKAITYADTRRDLFPVMFEAISATIFFGTPFNGAKEAAWAAMYAQIAEKFGQACSSKLLDFMKPGEETLRELRQQFVWLVGKLNPSIQVVCFWEQEPTDFTKMAHLPTLFGLTKALTPKSTEMVTRESAVLDGVPQPGLARNHRDLVKFDGPKDTLWTQTVREHLKRTINKVQLVAKNRLTLAQDLDLSDLTAIMEALGGALGGLHIKKKRKEVASMLTPSWITNASEYVQWFGVTKTEDDQPTPDETPMDCLWIRGREGRGKTAATIAALESIETFVKKAEEQGPGQDTILLAYFLCEPSTDYCTAEDLLRSLLCQLIDQQYALATHAKGFAKRKMKDGPPKSQAQPTIENLWQCLQDMLLDEFVGRRVYFVLSNLHVLPEESESTAKLMSYLGQALLGMNAVSDDSDRREVSTRWFITSRDTHGIRNALGTAGVRLVDLENEKYGDQVQMELRKHAKLRVTALETSKKYPKALAFFASSLIGRRAQNMHWIDIACVQLEELPELESQVKVRQILQDTPQDLGKLLNETWRQIFRTNADSSEKIKELLRALVLTFEDPTEDGLGVLAGLSTEEGKEELHSLIEMCKPFLTVKETTVGFMNSAVKDHLLENSAQLLGLSAEEIKWQHGMLALRSLAHIKEAFDFPETVGEFDQENTSEAADGASQDNGSEDGSESGEESDDDHQDDEEQNPNEDDENKVNSDGSDMDSDDNASSVGSYGEWDDESKEGLEAKSLKDYASAYPVKHWLHHGSKATAEFADDLILENEFWKRDSLIRRRWLTEYNRMTGDFDDFNLGSLTALHVAASIGFRQLVVSLLDNGYEGEIMEREPQGFGPLHFSARFGRPNIAEELLDRGVEINDGEQESEETALHIAAKEGHVHIMKKLLFRGAKPDAFSDDYGLVINAAISSGKVDTVELLVQAGVSLTPERDDVESPLAQAATMSDLSMLEYLMKEYAQQLPPEEYSKAMVSAARAGRIEIFRRLLDFQHGLEDFQWALNGAAEKAKWEIVTMLLEKRSDLDCDEAFYQAATGVEDKDDVLEALWEYTHGSISSERVDDSLYTATDCEKDSTVRLLLEKFGADPNAAGEDYGNALTAAAYDGRPDILQLLLEFGADVNSPNGWAIQIAAQEGHADIVRELIARGADVNAFTANENFPPATALQGATEHGQREVVELLLQHNANPNLGGGDDAPPILAAAIYAEVEILDMLVDAGADVNAVGGDDQSTPLINAVETISGTESLQKLLDAGAHIDLPRGDGETALIAAARWEHEIVEFLLEKGADVMHTTNDGLNALMVAADMEDSSALDVLVSHISFILSALKHSTDSGNTAVATVVQAGIAASKASIAARKRESADPGGSLDESTMGNDHETKMGHGGNNQTVEFSQQNIMTPPANESLFPSTQTQSGPFIEGLESLPASQTNHQEQHTSLAGVAQPNPHQNSPYVLYAGGNNTAPQRFSPQPPPATPPIRRKPAPTGQASFLPYSPSPNRDSYDQNGPPYQAYAPSLGASSQGSVQPTVSSSQLTDHSERYSQSSLSTQGNAYSDQIQPQLSSRTSTFQREDLSSYDGSHWVSSEPRKLIDSSNFGAGDQYNGMMPSQQATSGNYPGTATPPHPLHRPPVQQHPYSSPAAIQPYRDSRNPPQQTDGGQNAYPNPNGPQGSYPGNSGNGNPGRPTSGFFGTSNAPY